MHTKQTNLRYKIVLYFSKTGNVFEVYTATTRKAAEKAVRERKLDFKVWAKEEPRPNAMTRGWVQV